MTVSINTSKYESEVVQVLKTWATSFPAELVLFDKQMRQAREVSATEKGISKKGNLRKWGELPARVNSAMAARFGKDWHNDVKLRDIFWQHFQIGRINRSGFNDRLNRRGTTL